MQDLDASHCDDTFAVVGDGRQWFIPATELGGRSASGRVPKYQPVEVEPGRPICDKPPWETVSKIGL